MQGTKGLIISFQQKILSSVPVPDAGRWVCSMDDLISSILCLKYVPWHRVVTETAII
jgi:hypothetical protein